jgi:hypothetical protein
MPASKKDLKKNQQKKNVAAGIGDEKGRLPSQNKVATFGSYRYRQNNDALGYGDFDLFLKT